MNISVTLPPSVKLRIQTSNEAEANPIDRHERILYYYMDLKKRLKINNYSCCLNINKILSVVTYFS